MNDRRDCYDPRTETVEQFEARRFAQRVRAIVRDEVRAMRRRGMFR